MTEKKYPFSILLILLTISQAACGLKSEKNTIKLQKEAKEVDACYYSQLLNQVDGKLNEDDIFKIIENHELVDTNDIGSVRRCKYECSNLSINAVYESLLAKHLYENPDFNEVAAKVMTKIFDSLQSQLTPSGGDSIDPSSSAPRIDTIGPKEAFNYSVDRWISLKTPELPVLPVDKFYAENKSRFPSRSKALRYALGFDDNGNIDGNSKPIAAFQFSYFMFNSKAIDSVGVPKWYQFERNVFLNSYLRKIRGFRDNKPLNERKVLRTQYGITPFDVPELEAPQGTRPWPHFGRDICVNQPILSQYGKSVKYLQIPLVCGISGSTNTALWSLFSSRVDLTVDEVRVFLLLTWSLLSLDGGHSLQEVLTAAKTLSDYIELMDRKLTFHNQISPITRASLHVATENVVALDYDFLNHDESLIKRIETDILLEEKGPYYINYWKDDEKSPSELDKKRSREIQYYFTHARKPISGVKFGQYAAGFFTHISWQPFKQIKKHARDELTQYFKSSCATYPN